MNTLSILSFAVLPLYIFLGWYIFNLEPKSPVNRIFLLLSACFSIWAFSFAFFYSAPDIQTAWFWYNLSALGRFFYPALLLSIVLFFTKNKLTTENWYYSLIIYIPALIFLYAIFAGPFITKDLLLINSQWYEDLITNNFWWYAYNSYYLLYDFIALLIIGWWGYNSSFLREKRQALIIIFTGVVALTLGIITNTILQSLNFYVLPSMAQIFGVIFFSGIGYAIIKYQLLKINITAAAEQIISKITDLVILIDPDGKIIKTNPRTENLLEYSASELEGKNWEYLIHQSPNLLVNSYDFTEAREQIRKIFRDPNEQDKSSWISKNLELSLKTKNGEEIPVNSFISVINDKYGVMGVLMVGQDLRQTRKLEHEIGEKIKAQKSSRTHSQKLEILNQIITSMHNIDDLNSLFKEILNYSLKLSNFSRGGIYLIDDKQKARLKHWENLTPEYIDNFNEVDIEKYPFNEMIKESKFISAPYNELYPRNIFDWGFKSASLIPMISQDQVLGYIDILSEEQIEFSDSQIEIIESLGREVGAAIDRIKTEDEIKKSLKEKEVLLKEIHHRVKNNMQIISSLLNLQSGYLKDKAAVDALKECQGRIMSMAMIHENLYRSDTLSGIKFEDYINRMVKNLFLTYNINSEHIKLNIDAPDTILDIDTAIPCGLIVNELVTNSLKHAFPDGAQGEISIRMHQNAEGYNLIVADNGIGIPEEKDINKNTTLGLMLVKSLVDQLDGKLDVNKSNGTIFQISFKKMDYPDRI